MAISGKIDVYGNPGLSCSYVRGVWSGGLTIKEGTNVVARIGRAKMSSNLTTQSELRLGESRFNELVFLVAFVLVYYEWMRIG